MIHNTVIEYLYIPQTDHTSLITICHQTSYYGIINYILYAVHYIHVIYLFYN